MLISVLYIKVTCEWHKAIKLNYKNTRTTVAFALGFQVIDAGSSSELSRQRHCIPMLASGFSFPGLHSGYDVTDGLQYVDTTEAHTFRWPLAP